MRDSEPTQNDCEGANSTDGHHPIASWRPVLEELRPGWSATLERDRLEELCDMLDSAYREARNERRLPPSEARRWALERLGSLNDLDRTLGPWSPAGVVDSSPPKRGRSGLHPCFRGLRLEWKGALRSLRRDPWSMGFALLVLSLGLGCTMALFSLVQSVVLRELPYIDADRIGIVEVSALNVEGLHRISSSDVLDFRESAETLAALELGGFPKLTLGSGAERRLVRVASMDAGLPALLGVRPARGRLFEADLDTPERGFGGVLLTHETWTRDYGASEGLVGGTILLADREVQVVGVLPPGQQLWLHPGQPEHVALWTVRRAVRDRGTVFNRRAFVRLAPGASFEQATAEIQALAERGRVVDGAGDGEVPSYRVTPLAESLAREARPTLLTLLAAAACVLLLACCNVTALLAARSDARRQEWATRAALGAGRSRLLLTGLLEGGALALAAGTLGLAVAVVLRRLILAWPTLDLPRASTEILHWQTATFAAGAVALTALLAGALPALKSATGNNLHRSARSSIGWSTGRWFRVLPALQIAMALTLLAGAGALLRGFVELSAVDVGFEPSVATFDFALSPDLMRDDVRRFELNQTVLDRLGEQPGVESAGLVSVLPFSGRRNLATYTYDQTAADLGGLTGSFHRVFPGTLRTLGIELLRGRDFEPSDSETPNSRVIISRSLATSAWPDQSPIGQSLYIDFATDDGGTELLPAQVIGLVEDVHEVDLTGEHELPQAYLVYGERSFAQDFVVRSPLPPRELRHTIRSLLAEISPEYLLDDFEVLSSRLRDSTSRQRLSLLIAGGFAVFALLIATMGVYAAMRQRVVRRRQEIGLRLALGADRRTISGWILRWGLWIGVQGCFLGLLFSFALLRSVGFFAASVTAFDPAVLTFVPVLLLGTCALASWWPARRAGRVDPVRTLGAD